MKIKQSFIDRCGEITVKQAKDIARYADISYTTAMLAILSPRLYNNASDIWKATASVLRIDLSDIYEVEQLPNTLTE